MCSDHFHPWTERQGQSAFAWSWLGAALEATRLSFGTVCSPWQRYHPAIIAQAAATLAEMYPDRFWLAVGSGEALNESITGDSWPEKSERNRRLKESVDVMRALWAGDTVTHHGAVTVREARLYTRPARPPLLLGAAITADTARWVGGWADGLITVAGPRDSIREVVEAFREGGGDGKPMWLQVALAYASTDQAAARGAEEHWPQAALTLQDVASLATPWEFDRACDEADLGRVHDSVRVSSDIERQLAWLREDVELGFDRLYLHNVIPEEQERFIDACATRVLPTISRKAAAA